jgi:DNA-binding MarR family transcriptional regulator
MKPVPRVGTAEELALERFLPYRLSVLTNRISGQIARLYAERFALTIPEWRVMAVLGRFGAMSANEIVERTAMDKVRVSRAVALLGGKGRLRRRADPADRRRVVLDLSRRGRAVYQEVVPLALGVEARLLAPLSAAERALVERVIARLEACAAANFAGAKRRQPT